MPKVVMFIEVTVRALLTTAMVLVVACTADTPQALIASGNAYYAKKEFKAAALQYKSALQLDPSSKEARRRLGETLLTEGDVDGAILELSKAMEDKSQTPLVLPILSRALLLAGDYRRLVTNYGDANLADPAGQAELKTNVATAWGSLRELSKVESNLEAALKAVPNHGPALVLKARLLATSGQFDPAVALLDQVVARDPKSHPAWLLRGEIQAAKRDTQAAEESFRKAIAAEPTYVQAHSALIMSRVRQRDLAGAKVEAEKLRALLPNHPYAVLVGAQIAFAEGKPAQAREQLQLLLRVFPDNPSILVLSGAVEARLGAVTQGAAQFGKALRYEPTLAVARRALAELELRQGQLTQALETLKPLLEGAQADPDALSLAGDIKIRLREPAAAEAYYARAVKADPSNLRFQTAKAASRLARGDAESALAELKLVARKSEETYADEVLFAAHLRRREYDAALATVDTMARKTPGRSDLIELRGQVLLARRDFAGARSAFEQAAKADPGLFAAIDSLVRLDIMEGKLPQAIARLEESTRANRANSAAWLLLADLKSRQGTASVADITALYNEAAKAAPAAVAPRLQLIEFLIRKNQFKEALAAAQAAAAAIPGEVQILDAVGQAQMRAGDLEQAATTFRKLAIALPTSPTPYMRLAELYSASGKRDQAESALNKAIEIDPSHAPAQEALVDILIRSNRDKDALGHIRRVRDSRPNLPMGYSLEATYHNRHKNIDAAAAALREGAGKTGNSDLAGRLYSLLTQAGRTAEAEKFGAAWMKEHPKDAGFELLLAGSDVKRKDYKTAEARLRRVVAQQGNHALALNNLAWVLVTTGGSGAVAYAQRAADLAPNQAIVLDTLALALAADKQAAAALEVQHRAVELAPDNKLLRLNLAKRALDAGDKALAKAELLQLQKLGTALPVQEEVGKLLQGL